MEETELRATATTRCMNLQTENEELKKNLKVVQQQLDESISSIQRLETKNETLKERYMNLEFENQKLIEDLQETQNNLEDAQQKSDEKSITLVADKSRENILFSRTQRLETENEKLKKVLKRYMNLEFENQKLIQETQNNLEDAQQKSDEKSTELLAVKSRENTLFSRTQRFETENETLKEEKEDILKKKEKLEKENQAYNCNKDCATRCLLYFCRKKKYGLCRGQLEKLSVNDREKSASSRRRKTAKCHFGYRWYEESGYIKQVGDEHKIKTYDIFLETLMDLKLSHKEAILAIQFDGKNIGHCIVLDHGKLIDPLDEEVNCEMYRRKKVKSIVVYLPHVEKFEDLPYCKSCGEASTDASLPDASLPDASLLDASLPDAPEHV